MRVCLFYVSVQQSYSRGEETVSESGCPAADAAEPPARGQHGKQSMVGVGGVRGDALGSGPAAFMPNVLDGGERGPDDSLLCPHHPACGSNYLYGCLSFCYYLS